MEPKLREAAALIALFNHNVTLEHGAIFQYLVHAYTIGEAGVGAEIINIARSEMRHLKYFADSIVEWGGTVTLDRAPVKLEARSAQEMIQLGLAAEEDAIRVYSSQLERIDHPGAQRILARVLADEHFHHGQFAGFEREVVAASVQASYPHEAPPPDPALATMINDAFGHEYNQVLVYLRHYFQVRDWEAKDFLFENVFWHMKTMSFLVDQLHEQQADPDFSWAPQPQEGPPEARIHQALAMERDDQARYAPLVEGPIPPELKAIFRNTAIHAGYQEGQMRLLAEILAQRSASPAWTVGSLLGSPDEQPPQGS